MTGLGMMSGSSLDGVDLAICHFVFSSEKLVEWSFGKAETFAYPEPWPAKLAKLPHATAMELAEADVALGHLFGAMAQEFLDKHNADVDFIASHGHTIFHYPHRHFTTQIGQGACIAATTGITTIDGFRQQDVALAGQGAPLAPTADTWLFPGFDCWVNLGGIANMTIRTQNKLIAFDITGANQVLNHLARQVGKSYDKDGMLSEKGKNVPDLFEKLNRLEYHGLPAPKSLGNNWIQEVVIPIYDHSPHAVQDKLYTACLQIVHHTLEAFARQGATCLAPPSKMLITGGGAKNLFLIDLFRQMVRQRKMPLTIVVPDDPTVIDFKEAALMALMGALRLQGIPNCLPEVTGAKRNVVAGAVHWGWKNQNLRHDF